MTRNCTETLTVPIRADLCWLAGPAQGRKRAGQKIWLRIVSGLHQGLGDIGGMRGGARVAVEVKG